VVTAAVVAATALVLPSPSWGKTKHSKTKTWYVSATAGPNASGSRRKPFGSLAAVQNAARPGDTIVVLPTPVSRAPLDGGIQLKPRQRLIGAGPSVAGRSKQL
jgi:hypothetical protein